MSKAKQAASARKHYEANKAKVKERAVLFKRAARIRNYRYLKEFLQKNPCVDCGESDIVVLEFDHVRGEKSGNVSDMANRALSITKIQKEIEKCEIRCANCHRRKTRMRDDWK